MKNVYAEEHGGERARVDDETLKEGNCIESNVNVSERDTVHASLLVGRLRWRRH